jgi:glutathione-specific gamma-glutamylcyclotransferase
MSTPPPDSDLSPALRIPDHPPGSDLWAFAYGSLMWNPGFPTVERRTGLLLGWHRRFCLYSWHHRGTVERPGAVLGLDRGGACRGVVWRVAADQVAATLDYLWQREMQNYVYRPRLVRVQTESGPVQALAFTVDRAGPQYCGELSPDALLQLIRQGEGVSGRACDYLASLVAHLQSMGIRDSGLEALLAGVKTEG